MSNSKTVKSLTAGAALLAAITSNAATPQNPELSSEEVAILLEEIGASFDQDGAIANGAYLGGYQINFANSQELFARLRAAGILTDRDVVSATESGGLKCGCLAGD